MRLEEVYKQLDTVLDPELDQSLTELDFIHEVRVDGDDVTVTFRLPTYWCAPNFAFLMASDIRNRVSELPWVNRVCVILLEHCDSDTINEGVSQGKSFTETFPGLSNEELDTLRTRFRRKSYLSRQERLYRYLVRRGWSDVRIAAMTVAELESADDSSQDGVLLRQRYLEIRAELFQTNRATDTAFVDLHGNPIAAEAMSDYMVQARRTRVSQEINAVYCRGLFRTRYEQQPAQQTEAMHE